MIGSNMAGSACLPPACLLIQTPHGYLSSVSSGFCSFCIMLLKILLLFKKFTRKRGTGVWGLHKPLHLFFVFAFYNPAYLSKWGKVATLLTDEPLLSVLLVQVRYESHTSHTARSGELVVMGKPCGHTVFLPAEHKSLETCRHSLFSWPPTSWRLNVLLHYRHRQTLSYLQFELKKLLVDLIQNSKVLQPITLFFKTWPSTHTENWNQSPLK